MTVAGKRIAGGTVALAALLALGGCGGGGATGGGGGPASGMAVINGDFVSAAVSLLNADGTLAKDDCIDSGTGAGGTLSFTLSGDITLPSQPQLGGKLWIVDRINGALTTIEPTTCKVDSQVSVTGGAKLNPHDVLVVSDKKIYVTRFDKNLASTDPAVAGDDIAIVDRDSGAVTGHIDLSTYASAVDGAQIQARPDRMVLAGGKVYVTLNEADAMFGAYGLGRVAVIDPATDVVSSTIDLPGLKGCEAIYHAADTSTLYVGCGGSFADADQAAGSGVAAIDLSSPADMKVTRAAAFGQPVSFLWVVALTPARAFTSTMGTFADAKNNIPGTNDKAFAFDATTGTTTALGLEAGALDLGRGAVSAGQLFVPDATSDHPRIHVFDTSGAGAPTETSSFDPDPAKKLPPREIAWY